MIVLNGKKIKYSILGIFVMFLVTAITISSKTEKNNYIDTVSLPVSGKVVVVDAGHGIPDERSRGWRWDNRGSNKLEDST